MSHWYDIDGKPCHEIMGAGGKLVKTTLRQARTNSLFPSVTGILDVLAKPGLLNWQYEQITRECLVESPLAVREFEETHNMPNLKDYHRRMIKQAFEQVKDAADAGSLIHNALEQALQGKPYDEEEQVYLQAINEHHSMSVFVKPVLEWVCEEGIEIKAHELRLVNKEEGYAGTTDCAAIKLGKDGILDFKSKKTKKGKKVEPYDEQIMQIAAYDEAYYEGIRSTHWGCNLFISTTEPGRIEASWYNGSEMMKAYEAFKACCSIWRFQKNYDCRMVEEVA